VGTTRHNLQFEDTITLPEDQQDHAHRVFGAPLDRLMGPNGENGLPQFIQDCVSNLIANGLYVEGLFRRSPSSAMLKQVRAAYDRGNPVNLSEYDIHISAVLLKLFLRELPEPIFPASIYGVLQETSRNEGEPMTLLDFIRSEVLSQITPNNLILMMEIFRLLKMVADRHESNKMTPYNLAVVITPNMLRHSDVMQEIALGGVGNKNKDSEVVGAVTLGTVVKVMIESYDEIL